MERRGAAGGMAVGVGGASSCVIGVLVGSIVGGGLLCRVVRWCSRGAVRVMAGAVGLEDVGVCGVAVKSAGCSCWPPFEVSHGSVSGSVWSFVGLLVA